MRLIISPRTLLRWHATSSGYGCWSCRWHATIPPGDTGASTASRPASDASW